MFGRDDVHYAMLMHNKKIYANANIHVLLHSVDHVHRL